MINLNNNNKYIFIVFAIFFCFFILVTYENKSAALNSNIVFTTELNTTENEKTEIIFKIINDTIYNLQIILPAESKQQRDFIYSKIGNLIDQKIKFNPLDRPYFRITISNIDDTSNLTGNKFAINSISTPYIIDSFSNIDVKSSMLAVRLAKGSYKMTVTTLYYEVELSAKLQLRLLHHYNIKPN